MERGLARAVPGGEFTQRPPASGGGTDPMGATGVLQAIRTSWQNQGTSMIIKDFTEAEEHPPLDQQEYFILGPYIDLLEAEDREAFASLADHAGISLDDDDPLRSILQHYWLGGGFYDLEQAMEDLTSFPAVADYLESRDRGAIGKKLN
jgi:hypothetical protein